MTGDEAGLESGLEEGTELGGQKAPVLARLTLREDL